MKLKNKVALITGAASGIGHEIAKLYAKEGGEAARRWGLRQLCFL